jgi:predicted RNA-binding protein with PIN domain
VSTERVIVVDGYNLILRSPALRPGGGRTLLEARDKLVNLLSWSVGAGDARFIVVFDGSDQGGPDEGGGRVEVRFSRPPQKADDVIRSLVESLVDRVDLTVVTADLEVARHARAMGAQIALADLFLSSILGPAAGEAEAPEKPATLTRRELEEWAELFRNRKPGGPESEE